MDKYARAKEIAPLLNRFITYRLIPVANNYLLSETFNALIENKRMNERKAYATIEFIKKIALMRTERAVYAMSADANDSW